MCFKLCDDEKGSSTSKYRLYTLVTGFLACQSKFDKDVLSRNKWVFDESVYFNNLGLVKTENAFIKRIIELTEGDDKDYFERRLEEFNKNQPLQSV